MVLSKRDSDHFSVSLNLFGHTDRIEKSWEQVFSTPFLYDDAYSLVETLRLRFEREERIWSRTLDEPVSERELRRIAM